MPDAPLGESVDDLFRKPVVGAKSAPLGESTDEVFGPPPRDKNKEVMAGRLRDAAADVTRFGKDAWGKLKAADEAAVRDPIGTLKGEAKAVAGGAGQMLGLAAQGVGGAITAAQGKGFDAGQQKVQAYVDNLVKGWHLDPQGEVQNKAADLLNVIGGAVTTLGDVGFDLTQSPAVGAGTQALATFLTIKPESAAGPFKGIAKDVKPGEPPRSIADKQVEDAFDQLAVTEPQAATQVADHVAKADPELGQRMKLKVKMKSQAPKAEQEAMGEEQVKTEVHQATGVHPDEMPESDHTPPNYWAPLHEKMQDIFYSIPEGVGTPAHLLLDDMIGQADEGYSKELLTKLRGYVDNIPVQFKSDLGKDFGGADGLYMHERGNTTGKSKTGPTSHWIEVRPNDRSTQTLVHELVHATTVKFMRDNPMHPLVQNINVLYTKVVRDAGVRDLLQDTDTRHYGFTDPFEFVAEAFSNPKFQKYLAGEHVTGGPRPAVEIETSASMANAVKRMYSKLSQLVRKALGLNEQFPNSMLHAVMVKSEQLMREQFDQQRRRAAEEGIPKATAEANASIDAHAVKAPGNEFEDREPRGLSIAKGKLKEYQRQLWATFEPRRLGKGAEAAEIAIASARAKMMRRQAVTGKASEVRKAFWDRNIKAAPNFLDKFETGQKFTDPMLQRAAERYRAWNQEIYRRDMRTGFEYAPRDHYIMHIFERADMDVLAQVLTRKFGNKWKDPDFIKDRTFDLYSEAVAAGFKPKFDNPEDIMLARDHASSLAEMQVDLMKDLEHWGFAVKAEAGERDIQRLGLATSRRLPTGQMYHVDNNAAVVLHNAFDSFSLWNARGIVGDAFRGMMAVKNALVPIRLLSAYHVLHEGLAIDNAGAFTRAAEKVLTEKNLPGAFKEMLNWGIPLKGSFWDNPRMGDRVVKLYSGHVPEAALTETDRVLLQHMDEGGFVPFMSHEWKSAAGMKFAEAVRRRSAKAIFKAPFALIGSLQKPMFEWWIPRLKTAAYTRDVAHALERNPDLANNRFERMKAFRQIGRNIDERYGEMAYNNMFWPRWVKDLAVMNMLSLGWTKGWIGQFGGAVSDVAMIPFRKGSVSARAARGELNRPLWAMGYSSMAMGMTGLLSYTLSGKFPSGMDWFWPQTGQTNPDGSPKRLNTMFFTREFASLEKRVEHSGVWETLSETARSKQAGTIPLITEAFMGVNSLGQEIRDPDGTPFQKLEQSAHYMFRDIEPIAAQQSGLGEPWWQAAAGLSAAPKYAMQSKTEAQIEQVYQKYHAPKETPFATAERSQDMHALRDAYQAGDQDTASNLLEAMQEKYKLTGAEVKKLSRTVAKGEEASVLTFEHLTWPQQKKLLDGMTPEERDKYLPHASKQHRGEYAE